MRDNIIFIINTNKYIFNTIIYVMVTEMKIKY